MVESGVSNGIVGPLVAATAARASPSCNAHELTLRQPVGILDAPSEKWKSIVPIHLLNMLVIDRPKKLSTTAGAGYGSQFVFRD